MHVFVFESQSLIGDHRFGNETVLVGSAPDCSIRLRDSRIAQKHLRLCPRSPGDWIAEPLDTSMIPHINGRRLAREHSLRELDEISLGPFVLKFYFADGPREISSAPKSAGAVPAESTGKDEPITLTTSRWREFAGLAAQLAAVESPSRILEEIAKTAVTTFSAGVACVRLCGGAVAGRPLACCVNAAGQTVGQPALASLLDESCTQRLQRVSFPAGQTAGSSATMAAPVIGAEPVALGMVYIEAADHSVVYANSDLDLLSAFSAVIAPALKRALNPPPPPAARDPVAAAGGIAQAVQEAIAPRAMPNWPGLQVALYRRPGSINCCDIYDLLRLANGTAAFLMARVNARGATLPRLLAETRAAFRTSSLHADAPHVFARAMNWLMGEGAGTATIDLACIWIVPNTGAVKSCFAGRSLFAGVIPDGAPWKELTLPEQPAIGAARAFTYAPHSAQLDTGDVLAVGTCGIDHLRNANGEMFGRHKMADTLSDLTGTAASVMLSELATELDQFATGGACPDDVSLLLARRE